MVVWLTTARKPEASHLSLLAFPMWFFELWPCHITSSLSVWKYCDHPSGTIFALEQWYETDFCSLRAKGNDEYRYENSLLPSQVATKYFTTKKDVPPLRSTSPAERLVQQFNNIPPSLSLQSPTRFIQSLLPNSISRVSLDSGPSKSTTKASRSRCQAGLWRNSCFGNSKTSILTVFSLPDLTKEYILMQTRTSTTTKTLSWSWKLKCQRSSPIGTLP